MDREALLRLGSLRQVGNINAKILLSYCGSAEAVLSERKTALLKIPGISEIVASSVVNPQKNNTIQKELDFLEKNKVEMIPYFDEHYPKRLKQVMDSPIYLFVKGSMNLNTSKMVAVIGTRKNTVYGANVAQNIVSGFKYEGIGIASGLAQGIDGITHKTANDNEIKNCAVLAHGLDLIYPYKHRSLANEIIEKGGALITEHISGTAMHPDLFPRRNRIVAGMCDACVVIESGSNGGSMITARMSKKYNRALFAVPGRRGDRMSEGCNTLIKEKTASLCETSQDILNAMGWVNENPKKEKQLGLFTELNTNEKTIYELLQSRKLSYDQLLVLSQIPMGQLTPLLLSMEMKGLICTLPGKNYGLV